MQVLEDALYLEWALLKKISGISTGRWRQGSPSTVLTWLPAQDWCLSVSLLMMVRYDIHNDTIMKSSGGS